MLKLMKYEFRKTMFSKTILLVITAAAEIAYLLGVFMKWEKAMGIGVAGLVLCAMIGIFYIGVESLIVFHRELNTKQSYMLFLPPKNSFQVLGAKVLENGISIFLAGVFFVVLAAIDVTTGILYIGGLKEFLDLLHELMTSVQISVEINGPMTAIVFFSILASWLLMVVTGDLAIVLSATVLAGKKFCGLVSFAIFCVLGWIYVSFMNLLPVLKNDMLENGMIIAVTLAFTALMYAVAGWIMERRLSV